MMNKSKKAISLLMATALLGSTLAFAGCGDDTYKGDALTPGYDSTATVSSNGGFAVEKGEYVYFINGSENYTANNVYGEVEKASLKRISKTELKNGEFASAQTVVPSLFVAQNYDAGIFIYGDYVYYATPTTAKNVHGEVENTQLDFKRAKIDGTAAPEEYFFRATSNTTNYRFVQDANGNVYCLYEDATAKALKSYSVATGETTTLVSGASSEFFFDKKDPTNPNVYYTMAVKYNVDSANATDATYNQVYCANATTTVSVDASKASYTVKIGGVDYKTYDFDEKYLEEQEIDLSDYTAYPYVNLGKLVLDGVGSKSGNTQFNVDDKSASQEPQGYTYTVKRYENGGIYFQRSEAVGEGTKLYYLTDARGDAWNTVKANDFVTNDKVSLVALNESKASSTAYFEYNEGVHTYVYFDGSILKKATANADGTASTINLAFEVSGGTIYKAIGDYLYFYSAGTNGSNMQRINYKGTADKYNAILVEDEYKPVKVEGIDWDSSWYKPEFVGDMLLYSNAQSYGAGSTAYHYVYATKLGTTAEILARNESYKKVNEYIDGYSENSELQNAMEYYFRTGERTLFDEVVALDADLYDSYQIAEFEKFVKMFAEGGEFAGKLEKDFFALVGKMTDADKETVTAEWRNSLPKEDAVEETDDGMPGWAVALIIVGSLLVVAGVFAVVVISKKKAEAKREADRIVNKYKKETIDTTDDKTIDVYADETAEETVEESAEEATEPVAEAVEEEATEPVEETAEAPEEKEE